MSTARQLELRLHLLFLKEFLDGRHGVGFFRLLVLEVHLRGQVQFVAQVLQHAGPFARHEFASEHGYCAEQGQDATNSKFPFLENKIF